jgi:hypothetical protein
MSRCPTLERGSGERVVGSRPPGEPPAHTAIALVVMKAPITIVSAEVDLVARSMINKKARMPSPRAGGTSDFSSGRRAAGTCDEPRVRDEAQPHRVSRDQLHQPVSEEQHDHVGDGGATSVHTR